MLQALYAFAFHAWDHAFWLLTNIVLVVPAVYGWFPSKLRMHVEQHPILGKLFIPRWWAVPFALTGILVMTFLAFKDEYDIANNLRQQISGPKGCVSQLANMRGKYDADESAINGKNGLREQITTLLERYTGSPSPKTLSSPVVPELRHAVMSVTRIEAVSGLDKDGNSIFPIRLYWKNKGEIPGDVPVYTGSWDATKANMTDAEIEERELSAIKLATSKVPAWGVERSQLIQRTMKSGS